MNKYKRGVLKSMPRNEKFKLDKIASDSHYVMPVNKAMIEHNLKIFSRFIIGNEILEMGPAEGVMTEYLSKLSKNLTILEGSEYFCSILKGRFPELLIYNELFEDFRPTKQFDCIVLGHVLEHVENPISVVSNIKKWLTPNGRILASVPNARSLHRQAAVIMGLLKSEDAMSEQDIHDGHRRVFNPETFRNVFISAGLEIEYFGGFWIKPLSNSQIEKSWSPELLNAYMKIGERYPDIAAEICIVASNKN